MIFEVEGDELVGYSIVLSWLDAGLVLDEHRCVGLPSLECRRGGDGKVGGHEHLPDLVGRDVGELADRDDPAGLENCPLLASDPVHHGDGCNKDYHDHCEIGGHPVPEPAMSVLDHRDKWVEVTLYETALHGAATWHYLLRALEGIDPISEVERHHRLVDRAYEVWQRTETMDKGLRSENDE